MTKKLIVKFCEKCSSAESFALPVLESVGVPVPRLLGSGSVHDPIEVDFIVLEPILDREGNLAPLAIDYERTHREEIDIFLGSQLAKIHTIKGSWFGEVDDEYTRDVRFRTWGEYLVSKMNILLA